MSSRFSRVRLTVSAEDDLRKIGGRHSKKGYGPGNCRWATPSENQQNKRNC